MPNISKILLSNGDRSWTKGDKQNQMMFQQLSCSKFNLKKIKVFNYFLLNILHYLYRLKPLKHCYQLNFQCDLFFRL